jgi:hypothetical protein
MSWLADLCPPLSGGSLLGDGGGVCPHPRRLVAATAPVGSPCAMALLPPWWVCGVLVPDEGVLWWLVSYAQRFGLHGGGRDGTVLSPLSVLPAILLLVRRGGIGASIHTEQKLRSGLAGARNGDTFGCCIPC